MSWVTDTEQKHSYFEIAVPDACFAAILAREDEVLNEQFYKDIFHCFGKKVLHVACAAGGKKMRKYPTWLTVHQCPVYYENDMRKTNVKKFWDVCKAAATAGDAVVIHCNNSFHRAPILLAAIMVLFGYTKDEAFNIIASKRNIYAGHTTKMEEWPEDQRNGKHVYAFVNAHKFVDMLASETQQQKNVNEAAASRNVPQSGGKNPTGAASSCTVSKTRTHDQMNCSRDASTTTSNRSTSRRAMFWSCSDCNNEFRERNLRQCWVCRNWSCQACAYWCTYCTAQAKYLICGSCNDQQIFLRQCTNNIWACGKCCLQRKI